MNTCVSQGILSTNITTTTILALFSKFSILPKTSAQTLADLRIHWLS